MVLASLAAVAAGPYMCSWVGMALRAALAQTAWPVVCFFSQPPGCRYCTLAAAALLPPCPAQPCLAAPAADFDFGQEVLRQHIRDTRFPWLLSNVLDRQTGQPLGGALRWAEQPARSARPAGLERFAVL